jgi:hypothetical protein
VQLTRLRVHFNHGGRFHRGREFTISQHWRQWSIDPPFDARVRQLVRDWDANESPELIEEMIVTALKIARDRMSVADLKLINRSIKEMRNAAKVFAPFQHLRKVAIFGSARTPNRFTRVRSGKGFRSANGGAQFHGGHRWR